MGSKDPRKKSQREGKIIAFLIAGESKDLNIEKLRVDQVKLPKEQRVVLSSEVHKSPSPSSKSSIVN